MDEPGCDCNHDLDQICPNCGSHNTQLAHAQKVEKGKETQILPELAKFAYTDDVKLEMSLLYQKATNNKTKRNAPRRAIIYCCVMSVCKDRGLVFDVDDLKLKLDIKDKHINKVMKEIETVIGHSNLQVTMDDLLRSIMRIFDLRDDCLADMSSIYNRCKRASNMFNSSKIETLAYGIVYYYLLSHFKDFNQALYFEKSKVSRDTVLNISAEIQRVLQG